jgi:hypothetical protein
MDFTVRFSIEATTEAARMSRGWSYWPLWLLRNFYGIAITILIIAAGCKFLWKGLSASTPDFGGAALGALMALGPFGLYWWLRRRDIRRANKLLEPLNPLRLTFDIAGLNTTEKNGSRNFVPWSQFDGFREGKTVLLLREADPGNTAPSPRTPTRRAMPTALPQPSVRAYPRSADCLACPTASAGTWARHVLCRQRSKVFTRRNAIGATEAARMSRGWSYWRLLRMRRAFLFPCRIATT